MVVHNRDGDAVSCRDEEDAAGVVHYERKVRRPSKVRPGSRMYVDG